MRGFYILLSSVVLVLALLGAGAKLPEKNPFQGADIKTFEEKLKEPGLKIYFSGNIGGLRESCGCAMNPKGGLERRYNFLKKEGVFASQKDDVLILDFGNLLFKNDTIIEKETIASVQNAEKLAEATSLFNYTAVNLGALDRSVAPEQLKKAFSKSRFPWLASNISPPGRFGAIFRRRIPVKLKNTDAVLFGLSSQSDSILKYGWSFEKPSDVLLKELSDLNPATLPIVLSDLEMTELLDLAAKVKRPVIFIGSRESGGWDRPLEIGQALLLHIRHQGQDWGSVRINTKEIQNKNGWFNPAEASLLSSRWEALKGDESSLRGLASTDQKELELKNLKNNFEELLARAPQKNNAAYSFETTEMSEVFNGKNEVTTFMK